MPLYQTTGHLTGTIEPENVAKAQTYLTSDDMTQFLEGSLKEKIEHLEWQLDGNGHDYKIVAFAVQELSDDELKELSEWCSGQNSDGLGEGFEQQDFAEGDCDGDCEDEWCEGACGYGGMISFDWESNKLPWERVK